MMENVDERPMAFASLTLNVAEKNHVQVQKEALAIIWPIKSSTVICMEGKSL